MSLCRLREAPLWRGFAQQSRLQTRFYRSDALSRVRYVHKSPSDRVIIASEYYTHVMSGYCRFLAILHPLHRRSPPSPQLLLLLPYLLSFHTSGATLLIPILHVSSKRALESRSRSALRPDALDMHSPCLILRLAPSSRYIISLPQLGVAS